LQAKIETLRQTIPDNDIDRIRRLTGELQNALHALGQQVSAQQAHQDSAPPGNGNRRDEGEVIEGQFHEI
jgi:hypothetical protein